MPLLNADLIEVIQTFFALVGFGFSLWGVHRSTGRVLFLRSRKINGQRLFWTMSRVRQELLRLIGQAILVASGVTSLFLPPPDIPDVDLALQGKIRVWTLMAVSVIFALKTIFDTWDRERLERWNGIDRRTDSAKIVAVVVDEHHE